MPHSSTVSPAGWRETSAAAALGVVAFFSALVLFSFGGQVIIAPVLLPAQWLIARHTRAATSMAFSVLGALLAAELTWIVLALGFGENATLAVGGLVGAAGMLVGFLFFATSRPAGGG